MSTAPVYKAEDRSLLLPYYKRFLIEPTLPFIPARIHPNSITHVGHLLCLSSAALLLALKPTRGWLFIVSMILLQLYCWADNADGAHARRTKQSSAMGEFLDHGLDILNTVYIAILTAVTMGTSPVWTVAMVLMIPAAASITMWEQTQTGVFRLGLLNQIESIQVLSFAMIGTALFGTEWWKTIGVGPITVYVFFMWWPTTTILAGKLHGLFRVFKAGGPLWPALVFLSLQGTILVAAALGHLSVLTACAFVTAANVYFGVRMLVLRLHGQKPRVDRPLVAALIGALALVAWRSAGLPVNQLFGAVAAVCICLLFAVLSLLDTRQGVLVIERVEARVPR